MRLGKEQAAGYVEDTEAVPAAGEAEITIDYSEPVQLTPEPETVRAVV